MSQRISNDFINTNIPGAYFKTAVKSTPIGTASSGIITIIGEASGGASYSQDSVNLKDNFFTPDQLDQITRKYISGNIIDAFRALSSPSNDADIVGSATRIYVLKTNSGSQASATIVTAYGSLKDKNYGINGNKIFYQVSQIADEAGPSHEGTDIPSLGAGLTNAQFAIRFDGVAQTLINVFTGATTLYDTIAEVFALIDAALPAGLSCVASTDNLGIKIFADTDASANQKGYGKSFEVIETVSGDLAKLGLVEDLYVSSQEPEVQVDVKRTDTGLNESSDVKAEVAFAIGYEGTTAVMTINATTLTTTVTGGSGANLSITLADRRTIKDLADFINSQTGYSASVSTGSTQLPPSALDQVSALGICSTGSDLEPGRIKKSLSNFENALSQSIAVDFTATATKGLPDEMAFVAYLSGGTLGATLAADVITAIDKMESINTNFIVPLFSRDASEDITDGLTDSSSTYTIAATNAAVKSHVLKMSTSKLKKHRSAICSIWGSYSDAAAQASSLANARISLCMQKSSQVDSSGTIVNHFPWHTSCIAAGMQAAGFYKAIVNKLANVISFEDPSGFDSGNPGDVSAAIDAGLLFLEQAIVGNKWISDQTTYGVDTNFVYNSIQAMYDVDLVSLDLSNSFQVAFVGKSLADVDASTALSFLASKMESYKKQKLIAASDDAPLGFKNAKVSINGPILELSLEIKPASAIYFIAISIEVSQVQSSAG